VNSSLAEKRLLKYISPQEINNSVIIPSKNNTTTENNPDELLEFLLQKQVEIYRNRVTDKSYQRGKIVITTFQDYHRYINYLIPHFTGIGIKELSKMHVADFITKHSIINFKTVLDYLIPLKAIVKHQVGIEKIKIDIFKDQFLRNYAIETCKDDKRTPLPYTDKELDILRNAPHSHTRDTALFASITGLRIGELIALRWANIKMSKRKIYIVLQFTKNTFKRLKSEHGRRVLDITDEVLDILLYRHEHSCGCEFVFNDPHNLDSHWKNSTKINKELKRLHESLGIMHRSFHNTRKTFAKNDLKQDNNILSTAKKLGHKNPQETYNSYLEIIQDGFEDYEEDKFLQNLQESEDYE
jgi:integrase